MKQIEVICAYCGKATQKELKEYKRQVKSGQARFFCNLSCATFQRNKENPPKGNPQYLITGSEKDTYTPFRWFVARAKYRSKRRRYGSGAESDSPITVEWLAKLWEAQAGLCPLTGWELILPEGTVGWLSKNTANASLDRIDNSKGYVEGNVRFVSTMANMARNIFSDDELVRFCKAVTTNS